MFKDYKRMVLLDTETSGLSCETNEILELGAIILTKPEGSDKFSERKEIQVLVKNDSPITNSNIHGITEGMCKVEGLTKQAFFELMKTFIGDYKDTLVIAYNTPFDMRFIKAFMKQMDKDYIITNPTLDLLEVARDRTGLSRGNRLCDMLIKYEIKEEENSHRALDDTKATLAVMRKMWVEKNDLENYIRR